MPRPANFGNTKWGVVGSAHMGPQFRPRPGPSEEQLAEWRANKGQQQKPNRQPLLGPPGPPRQSGPRVGGRVANSINTDLPWPSVPTRQGYEDKPERMAQTKYLKKYGTLYPSG